MLAASAAHLSRESKLGPIHQTVCGPIPSPDVHHVVKRSQGGSDFDLDLLVALCRWCHDQTDAPYERGRLVVTALGAGQFTFEVVQRAGRGPLKPGPTFAHAGKNSALQQ
jgi:hypothetical protein